MTEEELIESVMTIRYVGFKLPLGKVPNYRLADELRSRGYDIPATYRDAFGCIPWEPGDLPAEEAIRRGR